MASGQSVFYDSWPKVFFTTSRTKTYSNGLAWSLGKTRPNTARRSYSGARLACWSVVQWTAAGLPAKPSQMAWPSLRRKTRPMTWPRFLSKTIPNGLAWLLSKTKPMACPGLLGEEPGQWPGLSSFPLVWPGPDIFLGGKNQAK